MNEHTVCHEGNENEKNRNIYSIKDIADICTTCSSCQMSWYHCVESFITEGWYRGRYVFRKQHEWRLMGMIALLAGARQQCGGKIIQDLLFCYKPKKVITRPVIPSWSRFWWSKSCIKVEIFLWIKFGPKKTPLIIDFSLYLLPENPGRPYWLIPDLGPAATEPRRFLPAFCFFSEQRHLHIISIS